MKPILKKIVEANDWAALKLMAFYGLAVTIWLFAVYSLLGAVVSSDTQSHMLYWSNAAQLVFCPLSIYVGKKIMNKSESHHQELKAQATQHHKEHMDFLKKAHPTVKEN